MISLLLVLNSHFAWGASTVIVRPHGLQDSVYTGAIARPAITSEDLDAALKQAAKTLETRGTDATVPATTDVPQNSEAQPLVSTQQKAENATPLTLSAKTAQSDNSLYTKMIIVIAAITVVGGATFVGVKKFSKANVGNKNKARINVVSQHALGSKKSLVIVHVAGESMLLGITENNISLIKSLSLIDDEVPEALPSNFSRALREVDQLEAGQDEFAAGHLNDLRGLVSGKLKGMRHLT